MSYWKGKKIVITGGAGMVGSLLSEFLIEAGAEVTIFDDGSRGKNIVVGAKIPHVFSDAGDIGTCGCVFRGKDAVFNLAAHVGGLYYNIAHQAEQFWGNMRLQVAPVLAAARNGVAVFLQTSTVCVYSAEHNCPAREIDGHRGEPERSNAGYAWAKRIGERVAHWAFAGTNTHYVIVRPTNVYGERDYFDERAHVIPALIRKFSENDGTVEVYGGEQSREFIYASDVARGMMIVAERGARGEAYNLGTSGKTQITIRELAAKIKRLTGSKGEIEFIDTKPTGDTHRFTDSSKAIALGWVPEVSLEDGLERVIRVYG